MRRRLLVLALPALAAAAGTAWLLTRADDGPTRPATTITSTRSGDWTDASTWGGRAPVSGDRVIVAGDTVVELDGDHRVSGVTVEPGATLRFDPSRSATLRSTANIVVEGVLQMAPDDASVEHDLQFVDVDETAFVGGGMEVLDTDVGLWVMGDGQLDVRGTPKSGWLRAAGAIAEGDDSVVLDTPPGGWLVGDTVAITPTEPITSESSVDGFDLATIEAIDGATITLDEGVEHPHPVVGGRWTPEVLNLTRNVRIAGTGNGDSAADHNGRAHVFIHSTKPQTVRHAELRHLGPRQPTGKILNGGPEGPVPIHDIVQGRYSLHFHHMGDGSRGSLVEGVVVRDHGARAFVPHASNGIAFRDTITFSGWESGYWWDPPTSKTDLDNDSDDITFDHALAALIRADPPNRGGRLAAFELSTGRNLAIRDSVAVGVQGKGSASGFQWPSTSNQHPNNVWSFEGNVAHNNAANGTFVWQNDKHDHEIRSSAFYNNGGSGIEHGAYGNGYSYVDVDLIGNGVGITQHAVANVSDVPRTDGYDLAFERVTSDSPILLTKHNKAGTRPTLYKDCAVSLVIVDERANSGKKSARYDFVNCLGLEPGSFRIDSAVDGMLVRVQRVDGTAFQIDATGAVSTIAAFYAR